MNAMWKLSVIGACVVGTSLAVAQPKRPGVGVSTGPVSDFAALADKLVGKTANVKEGEIIQIITTPNDMVFAEELAVAVRKRGAFPLITIESESLIKKLNAAMPEKYDTQAPKLGLGLAKLVNARIVLAGTIDPSVESSVPAPRRAARAKAGAPVADLTMKKKVRLIELGNGMAPSAWRAKDLGLNPNDLAKIYWDGLSADYTAIEEKGKALKAAIAKGTELRITMPNGTDLKMKIKGRKVFSSDGILSDADIKAGGANVMVWLPAGEVYVTPVPGSVEGKLVDDRMTFEGKEVTGITAEIKKGKITSITAKSGWDAVQARYDAAGPGKTEISVFDLGINPSVKATGKLETFVGAGTVTIHAGNNTWAGGTNKEPFGLSFHLNGASVSLDGKPLVETGTLK